MDTLKLKQLLGETKNGKWVISKAGTKGPATGLPDETKHRQRAPTSYDSGVESQTQTQPHESAQDRMESQSIETQVQVETQEQIDTQEQKYDEDEENQCSTLPETESMSEITHMSMNLL